MCAVPLMIGRTPMAAVRCSLLVLAAGMPSSAARAVLAQEQRTLAEANYTNLILAQNMQFDIFIVVHKGGYGGSI